MEQWKEWMQDIFDIMANRSVTITITGELGDVAAEIKDQDGVTGETAGAQDFGTALDEAVAAYIAKRTRRNAHPRPSIEFVDGCPDCQRELARRRKTVQKATAQKRGKA